MSDSYFPIVVEFTQGKNKGERKFVQSLDEIPNNVSFRVLKTKAVQSDYEESDSMPLTGDFSWIKVNRQHGVSEVHEPDEVSNIAKHYASTFSWLKQYDENSLYDPPGGTQISVNLEYESFPVILSKLKTAIGVESPLFGLEREKAYYSILQNLEQTFCGAPLYNTVETKAAELLYLVIKNHPFVDGNKRIASFLFLDFLSKNGCSPRGSDLAVDNGLVVCMVLLIANSDPMDKEYIINLIENILALRNRLC